MSTDTELELERLLQARNQHPDRAAEIDAQIRARFMETHAILVLDSSGFSCLSQEQGIIAALAEIERMRGVVAPIVEAHQGSPFKLEADNVYAVFPSVGRAIAASREMMRQLATIDKHVSIGIGYGDLIIISGGSCYHDVYGEEMNLASKLGEDLAETDEVLLTEAAIHQLRIERPGDRLPISPPITMTISNLTLQVYRLTPEP
ncbi:MAG: adenylate/guanylate cyclase domain-containing protein [Cyanobacteriota bacterium]